MLSGCTASYSTPPRHTSIGGPSFGLLAEEGQVLEGAEMSQHMANVRALKAGCCPGQPWDAGTGTRACQTRRGPAHTSFSLWLVIEIYAEAKKSWLHRNKAILHSRLVPLRSMWELLALVLTIQIIGFLQQYPYTRLLLLQTLKRSQQVAQGQEKQGSSS